MKNTLPVLLLKNLILLPNQEVKLELTNDLSCDVIKLSTEVYHNELIVATLFFTLQNNYILHIYVHFT